MSNSQAVMLVANQIVARLFDHRQFTSGEIAYLTKGMSQHAGENNLQKLLKTNESTCVISDISIDQAARFDHEPAKKISSKVADLVEEAERVLNLQTAHKTATDSK